MNELQAFNEAVNATGNMAQSGQYLFGTIVIVYMLLFVIKKFMNPDNKKILPVISGIMSSITAVIATHADGIPWSVAIMVVLSGPSASWFHDFLEVFRKKK